ncbi:hypothetical protein PCS_02415 [Desulfocurvibacter africanus PCS]|uniref:DUF362 domain-containing protein n=1 Tax=Desulfocurvibacter africanus PCS TaxID=1262666 RepID=M5PRM2_DESAF|nr:DUF362 domain-containing protein [Desulfocurvibacter africanus]EMG36720.1 hypothetical protein PCS_02415 [Desulfocurvibacter africanus PCS]
MPMQIDVALTRAGAYEESALLREAGLLLEAIGFRPAPGSLVLLKPNLVSGTNAGLSTTHPLVVRVACRLVLDYGARVVVADSPAFGSAESVAGQSGLVEALRGLPVKLTTLCNPRRLPLRLGGSLGLASLALEADAILNLPKFKAHNQMRVSAAVKNLFGCVVGCRKAIAHARWGDHGNRFESALMDVAQALLPKTVHLMDSITAMHVRGPMKGEPFPLGMLAASVDGVALDTAMYGLLGLRPQDVPLWAEALRRGAPGAEPMALAYPLAQPAEFDTTGFVIPACLDAQTFHPYRLIRGRLRSLCARFL